MSIAIGLLWSNALGERHGPQRPYSTQWLGTLWVIELMLSSPPSVLLRPDADKYLTGNLKAVRSFKPPKFFLDLGPSSFSISFFQLFHKLSKITGSGFFHICNSASGGWETSRYRSGMNGHIQKTSLPENVFKRPWISEAYIQGSPALKAVCFLSGEQFHKKSRGKDSFLGRSTQSLRPCLQASPRDASR